MEELEAPYCWLEEDNSLLALSAETMDFWDNPVDDAVWNAGGEADQLSVGDSRRRTMMIGKIGSDLRPMIPLVIQGANGLEKKIPVLLSTGFDETLILPPAEVAALGLPQTGTRTVTFPDGSQVEATVHPTKVLLAGEEHDVDLLAGGWEPRMGIKLLWGYRMSMRFTPGEPVVVERLKTPAE